MRRTAAGMIGSVLALLLLAAAHGAAPAQQNPLVPRIDRIDVLRPGIYEIEVGKPIPDTTISTGSRVEAQAYKSVAVTTKIEAKTETTIGVELTIVGVPRRHKVPLKTVWRYPEPGLTNPDTKLTKLSDEYLNTQEIGVAFPAFWGLTQDWHLVPGTWTLEVWYGDRKLLSQEFQVVRP